MLENKSGHSWYTPATLKTFNTLEKASHNMLETPTVTIIGYYQLDVELMLHARAMTTLH